jgi:hypothetical protein
MTPAGADEVEPFVVVALTMTPGVSRDDHGVRET